MDGWFLVRVDLQLVVVPLRDDEGVLVFLESLVFVFALKPHRGLKCTHLRMGKLAGKRAALMCTMHLWIWRLFLQLDVCTGCWDTCQLPACDSFFRLRCQTVRHTHSSHQNTRILRHAIPLTFNLSSHSLSPVLLVYTPPSVPLQSPALSWWPPR